MYLSAHLKAWGIYIGGDYREGSLAVEVKPLKIKKLTHKSILLCFVSLLLFPSLKVLCDCTNN